MKFVLRILGYIMLFFNMAIYSWWSKMWRFLLDRKYIEMPEDLPWTYKQVLVFFEMCMWTEDKLGGMLDYFMKPARFYTTERGDCDDFAAFAATVLASKYKAKILTVQWWEPKSKKHFHGHNVCIFKINNKIHHIGNWGLYGPFSNLDEAKESIARTRNGNTLLSWSIRNKDLKWLAGGCR